MPPALHFDPAKVDCSNIVVDREGIKRINPHRDHMLHVDAIVHMDREQQIIVGYKDVLHDEFWVSGHMPGYPLLPGVIMCEAAAQLACFYTKTLNVMGDSLLGLGGLENARFRSPVRPGDRLVLIGKGTRVDRRKTEFNFQGFVGSTMVFHCDVIGVPIPGQSQITPVPREKSALPVSVG